MEQVNLRLIDSEKLVFSHNGRPPQFVDYATNEISKMTKHSTSKANSTLQRVSSE